MFRALAGKGLDSCLTQVKRNPSDLIWLAGSSALGPNCSAPGLATWRAVPLLSGKINRAIMRSK